MTTARESAIDTGALMLMLEDLLKYDGDSGPRRLTDWEVDFIEDLYLAIEAGRRCTGKQFAKTEQIWKEIFPE